MHEDIISLNDLGIATKTDKSSVEHNYLEHYEALIPFERADEFTFVEIGVFRGSSARMWAQWFANATILGLDKKLPSGKKFPKNLKLVTADATKQDVVRRIQKRFSRPGVVLDDGSHIWDEQEKALRLFWDWLEPGGVYIVEDLHSSSESNFSRESPIPFVSTILRIAEFMHLRGSQRDHLLSISPKWFADLLVDVEKIVFVSSSALIFKRPSQEKN